MPRKIKELLFCEFTQEELDSRGQQLSSLTLTLEDVEARKKEATKEFSEELKGLRTQMRVVSKDIRRKGEERKVECMVQFHTPVTGTKRIVRTDTGELVREEPMSNAELQEELFQPGELERLYGSGPAEPEAPTE